MRRAIHSVISIGACAALLLTAAAARAQVPVHVTMNANRTELPVGESVVVQISVQTRTSDEAEIELPDFNGFTVVRRGVERPMQFSFGFGQRAPVVTSTTTYTFVLVANTGGQFRFPPVRVTLGGKAYQSEALTLTVQDAGAAQQAQPQAPNAQAQAQDPSEPPQDQPAQQADPAPQAAGDAAVFDNDAFLRTVIDKAEPYEGEQVTATLYLYVRRNLQQTPAVLAEATTDGFWTHDLLNPSTPLQPSRQVVNGRAFWVYVLRRFAAFPLRSGDLTIGSMALNISRESVFDIFNPAAAPADLQRKSVPLVLHVKPLPADAKPQGDLAVGIFELSAQLDRAQVATGDAVTLTATVRGVGNIASVRLASPVVEHVDVLQPETHELIESPKDLVQGTRTFAWLLVPKTPGTHKVAPLVLETFDPRDGAYHRVATEPLVLTAAGNAPTGSAGTAPTQAADPVPDVGSDTEKWPPLRARSALARRQAALADEPFFPWALLAAPLLWLLSVSVPWLRGTLRARAQGDTTRVAKEGAKARLDEAKNALRANDGRRFHVEVASALSLVLHARCGQPVTGLTRPQLRTLLADTGVPAQPAREVLDLLERCDVARFSPAASSSEDMQAALSRAERLCATLPTAASSEAEAPI